MNSTQEIGVSVGMAEKAKGTGRGTVVALLVACSGWARPCWVAERGPGVEREWGSFEGNLVGRWRRQGQKLEVRVRGLYHGGGMRDYGGGYANFVWGRNKLYLERVGYL